MWTQPINTLSPFEVRDKDNEPIIRVSSEGVEVSKIIFPDGSTMVGAGSSGSAGSVGSLGSVDSGTF